MIFVQGKVFDMVTNPEGTFQNGDKRPAYITVQVSGRVNTYTPGVTKAKLFDVAAPLSMAEKIKAFGNKTINIPVDAYASGKEKLTLRLLEGAEITEAKGA